jgi:hypothetical protein
VPAKLGIPGLVWVEDARASSAMARSLAAAL